MNEENKPPTAAPLHGIVMPQLEWDYTDQIRLDHSMMFGVGYDFFGLESLRREAKGPNGNYLMWPNGGKWSLYRDTDGALAFERYCSREECEQAAERWCADVLSA
jgi:hypothetical protein